MRREADELAWSAEGSYFEACNCVAICPCRQVGGRAGSLSTFGICDFALSWWITSGHLADIDLADRVVVMIGSYDDDEAGSPWTVTLFVDERADAVQQAALADIFLGRAGGTPGRNYTPAIHTVTGVHAAAISLDHRKRHWRIRVDGAVDVRAADLVASEETVACGIPGLDHPGQEVRTDALIDTASFSWEWSDRCGFGTDFAYYSDT